MLKLLRDAGCGSRYDGQRCML